jgi:hypothetical protein
LARIKSHFETFEMLRRRIPEKAVKSFSVRKGDPQDNMNTKEILAQGKQLAQKKYKIKTRGLKEG